MAECASYWSNLAAGLAKYVSMKSAPARRMEVSVSIMARSLIDPAIAGGGHDHREFAAHLVGAESARRNAGAPGRSGRDTACAGLTMIMSAPSSRSSSISRMASRPLAGSIW